MPSNERLVEAMRIVAVEDTPEHRTDLYEAMLAAELLVLTPDAPETTGPTDLGQGQEVSLITVEDEDGLLLPAFTDEQAILRFEITAGGYLAMPARSLFEMAAGAGTERVAIDPGSPTHGVLARPEIEALARGHLPIEGGEVVRSDTEVLVGVPSEPPPEVLVAAVRTAVSAEVRAEAAWIFLMHQPPAEPQLVVGVALAGDLDPDATTAAMRGIVSRAGEASPAAQTLGFLVADEGWVATLGGGAGMEIYRR